MPVIYNHTHAERRKQLLRDCSHMLNVSGELDVIEFLDAASEEEALLKHASESPLLVPLVLDSSRKMKAALPKAESTDMSARDWLRVVELALRFGRTILIEDFSKLDLAILAICRRQIFGVDGSRQCRSLSVRQFIN